MENTFEKILKDGERKGYFRVLNDGAKIEAGSTPNPTIETVKKITDALGVSLDDLMK